VPVTDAPPPLPVFPPEAKVCGACRLWSPYALDEVRGWVGPCRLQPQRGLFPPTAPICNAFSPKGGTVAARPAAEAPTRAPARSVAPVLKRRPPVELTGEVLDMTREELMDLFREAAGDSDPPPLAAKWEGGVIQLIPGKPDLQAKELPIDALFHKVVMVRDRLRTLEQKLNAHPKLTDAERVEMQQYITRCYGSLTSFNVLFREKSDQFVGQKGGEE
jgi:hypothetical protein